MKRKEEWVYNCNRISWVSWATNHDVNHGRSWSMVMLEICLMRNGKDLFMEETKYILFFEHETLSPTLQQCFLKISEIAGDWKVRYGRQELGSTTGVVGRGLDLKCMLNIYHSCLNRSCGLFLFLYPFVISSLFLPQQQPERQQVRWVGVLTLKVHVQPFPFCPIEKHFIPLYCHTSFAWSGFEKFCIFVFLHFKGRTGVVDLIVFLILKVRVQPFSSF